MAASEVLGDILQKKQRSNLNFNLNLLRKSFTKDIPPSTSAVPKTVTSIPVTEELKSENSELKDQNFQLLEQVEDLIAANQTFRDTVQVLEEKISKIEKAAFKEYEEKKHEVTMLKQL